MSAPLDYYRPTPDEYEEHLNRIEAESRGESVKYSRAKNDVTYFAVNQLGFRPRTWQSKAWDDLLDGKNLAICTSRQIGKTSLLAIYALWACVFNKLPLETTKKTRIIIVSKSADQSKKVISDVKEWMRIGDERVEKLTGGKILNFFTNKVLKSQDATNTKGVITFENRCEIISLPPTESARGYTGSILFLDEAAFFEDEEVFEQTLRPIVSQTGGRVCMTSTPNGQQGFFYSHFDPDNRFKTHQFTRLWVPYTSLYLDNPELVAQKDKERMSALEQGNEASFDQEYMASFNSSASAFFDNQKIDACIDETYMFPTSYEQPCDLAVDFGAVVSRTVVTISALKKKGNEEKIQVLYQHEYLPEKDITLIEDIESLMKRFNVQRIIFEKCLHEDTEIICVDSGGRQYPKKLKRVEEGESVLSYNFKKNMWCVKKVTSSRSTGVRTTRKLHLKNGRDIITTMNHQFFTSQRGLHPVKVKTPEEFNKDDQLLISKDFPYTCFGERRTVPEDLQKDVVGRRLQLAYLCGIYASEGCTSQTDGRVVICKDKKKNPEIYKRIKMTLDILGIKYSEQPTYLTILKESKKWKAFLSSFGKYCDSKKLPEMIYDFDEHELLALIQGLVFDGDGCGDLDKFAFSTTSHELAKQAAWICKRLNKPTDFREKVLKSGRICYELRHNPTSHFARDKRCPGTSGVAWRISEEEEANPVWDISVKDTESFVLYESGLIVHNCAAAEHMEQFARAKGWNLYMFNPSGEKLKKYLALKQWIVMGKVRLPLLPELIQQMKGLVQEQTPTRTKVHHGSGLLDDRVDSLMMSTYFFTEENKGLRVWDTDDY